MKEGKENAKQRVASSLSLTPFSSLFFALNHELESEPTSQKVSLLPTYFPQALV